MLTSKTYYEILGIAPHVGSGQIQAAYRFVRSLYSGEAAPTHGLLDAAQRGRMLLLVDEAYAALSNPTSRRDYDIHLNETGPRTMSARAGADAAASLPAAPASAPEAKVATEGSTPEGSSDPIHVPDVVNGPVLRSLRESRNLSIDQIAALSKVGSRFLKALEEDRHSVLPGRVFARGFLIEYARAIRAPESELVERYLLQWRAE